MQHFLFFNVLLMIMDGQTTTIMVHGELINQCRKGSQKAQMELYDLYYQAMFNTSMNIVGNAQEAEDIMQESFLKAFDLLPKTELNSSFGGWLKKIVVNRSLDVVRKRKVHFESVDELKNPVIEENAQEDQPEGIAEKIAKIKTAMTQLPEKYRVVLSLNLIEGYDHDEIGHILGITSSTSRAQLSRGKQKLLQLLN